MAQEHLTTATGLYGYSKALNITLVTDRERLLAFLNFRT